jgi:hypothetical protein
MLHYFPPRIYGESKLIFWCCQETGGWIEWSFLSHLEFSGRLPILEHIKRCYLQINDGAIKQDELLMVLKLT